MIFRGRTPESTVWQRFRAASDGFTFRRRDDVSTGGVYEAHVSANAERVVDLFYTLTERLTPAVDLTLDDLRTGRSWHGTDVALLDARDAIARMKVPLATYGGVEISVYSPDDQLSLTAALELFIYARSDRWLYLLQSKGLHVYPPDGGTRWREQPWNRAPVPTLTGAVEGAAQRLSLTESEPGGAA